MLWRLFEQFEQGIGGVAVHGLGWIDDHHALAGLMAGNGKLFAQLADLIDHDLG